MKNKDLNDLVRSSRKYGVTIASALRKHNLPTIDEVKALDGKVEAMLTEREANVLHFFRMYSRKYGVSIQVKEESDPHALASATTEAQASEMLDSTNRRIHVTVQ
jgi:hypothetical protein